MANWENVTLSNNAISRISEKLTTVMELYSKYIEQNIEIYNKLKEEESDGTMENTKHRTKT